MFVDSVYFSVAVLTCVQKSDAVLTNLLQQSFAFLLPHRRALVVGGAKLEPSELF